MRNAPFSKSNSIAGERSVGSRLIDAGMGSDIGLQAEKAGFGIELEEVELNRPARAAGDLDQPDRGPLAFLLRRLAQLLAIEGADLARIHALQLLQPLAQRGCPGAPHAVGAEHEEAA